MRRLTPLLLGVGLLAPTAALAASGAPLTPGEIAAVHVLKSAPVFTDPAAEAARAATPNKIRAIIGTSPIKVAIMPASAQPAGRSANDMAKDILAATGHPEAVLFVLVGREFGASSGSKSGLSGNQAETIAHTAFAAHQAGGFTSANVEAVLEDSATQAKGALVAVPSTAAPQAAALPGDDTSDSTHKDPPAWLVVGAVIVVVIVVFTVAIMSRLSRRHPPVEPVVRPEPQPDPEPTGDLPVVAETPAPPPSPPAPVWAWTGGEWEQAEPLEV